MTVARARGDGRPELVSFPSGDSAFARAVQTSVTTAQPRSPAELEGVLRRRFPRVVVRPRALSDEPWATWYVFRDGRVLPV